jgi:hypothetical protein
MRSTLSTRGAAPGGLDGANPLTRPSEFRSRVAAADDMVVIAEQIVETADLVNRRRHSYTDM